MGEEESSDSWVGTDIFHLGVSLVSPAAVIPLLIVGILWALIVFIPWAAIDALIGITLGDGLVLGAVETLAALLLVTAPLVVAGWFVDGMLDGTTPKTVPTNRVRLLWWAGLPVAVILTVAYGIVSGTEIRTNVQFVILFGLLVFGSLLIATRTLGVVHTAKGSSDVPSSVHPRANVSPDATTTVTTVVTGYVLVGGIIEAVTLFFDVPGIFGSEVTDWPGMIFIYVPVLLLLAILSGLSGFHLTKLMGIEWDVWRESTSANLGEIAETSPFFFNGATGDGMFVALAVAFIGIPGLVAAIELTWHGSSILSRHRKRKREFEDALSEYRDTLDTVAEHLDEGRYDDARELLVGSVKDARNNCETLADRHGFSLPESVTQRSEKLRSRLDRLDAMEYAELLIEEQEGAYSRYERAREAENFNEAAEALDEAERIAQRWERRTGTYDIDYSLPLPADAIEAEREDLERTQFESALAAYERELDTVETHLQEGRPQEASELLADSVEERRSACRALADGEEYSIPDETRQRHEGLSTEARRLEAKQDIEELVDRQEQLQRAYERAREAGNFDEAAERLDEAEEITRQCVQRAEGFDIDYSLPLPADAVEAERAKLGRQQAESALERRSTQFQRFVESATDSISDGELSGAGTAIENALEELSAIETLETEHDVTAPLDATQRDIVSRIRVAVVTAVDDQFGIDIAGDCECGREWFWTEAKARYRLAAASHAVETGEYDRAIAQTASVQEELTEQLDGRQTRRGDEAVLAQLAERAGDQHDTYKKDFIVKAVTKADNYDPSEYEAASRMLERAHSTIPETDAFDARQQSIMENDVRTAYVDVRADGAQFLVDRGEELLEGGDTAVAIECFEDAMTVLEETRDTIDRWETAEEVDDLDDAGRIQKVRSEADAGYVDAHTERISDIIHTGIDQFEEGQYDAAGETFREAEDAAATIAERVERDGQKERLRELERVASENAGTAHRTALGTVRDPSIRKPGDTVLPGTPGDGTPTEIPSVPGVELEYEDLESDQTTIGEGGNADVYHATAATGDGTVELAVKEPRISGTLHTETAKRMMDEAETWDKLDNHDHIVGVVDYGAEPMPWIAMEYMDAGHLGERAGAMDVPQALWTALAVTTGVRHAHRRGVAHLDLKPANVLFRSVEGDWDAPKVADWGLSKHLLDHSKSVDGISSQYAAPEQFDDAYGSPDDITDIYQLGAVFYELFTGRPPFEGQPFRVIDKVKQEDPTPPSEVADVPAELDDILLRALAKEKSERYDDIVYLRDDLHEVSDSV